MKNFVAGAILAISNYTGSKKIDKNFVATFGRCTLQWKKFFDV